MLASRNRGGDRVWDLRIRLLDWKAVFRGLGTCTLGRWGRRASPEARRPVAVRRSVPHVIRHKYRVTSDVLRRSDHELPTDVTVRPPSLEDRMALADLMMSAYIGTIDYDGETHEQAVQEVDGWFDRDTYLDTSRVAVDGSGEIVAAVLNSTWDDVAMVGYVMTSGDRKGQGIASALVDMAVHAMLDDGFTEVTAWITEGNLPSEAIFTKAGFAVVDTMDTEA